MRATILRLVLRLYPLDWRERYAAEVAALIEDAGFTWRTLPSLLYGAIAEWIALASSPDRRRVWLGRPSGRRLFASAALVVPLAAMWVSALVADALVPIVPDESWVLPAAAGVNVVFFPIVMWRFMPVYAPKRTVPAAPAGAELRFWLVALLVLQLITHMLLARSVQFLPWPTSWMRAVALLGYVTLPTLFLLNLCLQLAARRFERVTGLPLQQPRRKPPVPPQPLGL